MYKGHSNSESFVSGPPQIYKQKRKCNYFLKILNKLKKNTEMQNQPVGVLQPKRFNAKYPQPRCSRAMATGCEFGIQWKL